MAVYTMELRTLCAALAGASEHAGFGAIDGVIDGCWEQVFSGLWNTYDPVYKEVLCRKILKHYWMREIGTETTDLFLHYLNTRLDEVMPYYNELYKSATLDFDPLHDYDLQTTSKRTTDGETANRSTVSGTNDVASTDKTESTLSNSGKVTSANSGSVTGDMTGTTTDENTGNEQAITKFSDTPQGELSGVLNGTYLTNATVVDKTADSIGNKSVKNNSTETSESNGTETSESTSTETRENSKSEQRTNESTTNDTGTAKTTEDYVLSVKGKTGGKSYSALLTEYRKTLINIDKLIIDELSDLFMGLWA